MVLTSGNPLGRSRASGTTEVFLSSDVRGAGSDADGSAVYSVKARLVCLGISASFEMDESRVCVPFGTPLDAISDQLRIDQIVMFLWRLCSSPDLEIRWALQFFKW
jgi:hypothetical protein